MIPSVILPLYALLLFSLANGKLSFFRWIALVYILYITLFNHVDLLSIPPFSFLLLCLLPFMSFTIPNLCPFFDRWSVFYLPKVDMCNFPVTRESGFLGTPFSLNHLFIGKTNLQG